MARMTDSDYAQATKMGRELYQFLADHGEDGDGFSNLFSSLDSLYGAKDCKQTSDCEGEKPDYESRTAYLCGACIDLLKQKF